MGRLSTMYDGRVITTRVPFVMEGFVDLPLVADPAVETAVSPTEFNENFFRFNVDKPFEIHRMIPRIVQGVVTAGAFVMSTTIPNQETALAGTKLRLNERSRNEALTSGFVPILNMVKGTSEFTWEWADPMVLVRGQGFKAAALYFSNVISAAGVRLQLSFQGFLLVLAPASDHR